MALKDWFSRQNREQAQETRASIENPTVPVSADNFLAYFGLNSANLPSVTIDSALTVPAVWDAVAFLSRTLAALPRHAYRNTKTGAEKISGRLETVVNSAPNDSIGSFAFWQWFWQQVFTGGRGAAGRKARNLAVRRRRLRKPRKLSRRRLERVRCAAL